MKILIDTNIILDVLYRRSEFKDDSLKVLEYCEMNRDTGYISALSVPNMIYVMRKELDQDRIEELVTILTNIFTVADLRESDLVKAADLRFSDYEDALQCACAARIKADYIVTRNIKDFQNSPVPAILPSALWDRI